MTDTPEPTIRQAAAKLIAADDARRADPTPDQLDEWVGTVIMGFERRENYLGHAEAYCDSAGCVKYGQLEWWPTRDKNQAFMALDKWRGEGRYIEIMDNTDGPPAWDIDLVSGCHTVGVYGKPLAEAICLALWRMGQAEGEQP
jgi:hypothetical protein